MISIIIPIYNASKSILTCVNSIIKSGVDKSKYEILLINDGSQDNSLEICKHIESNNNNIHVFSHENVGTSTTRNVGLENATGEYVWFVDADDYIETSFLEQLLDFIRLHPEYEVISFDYIKSGELKHDVFRESVVTGIAFLEDNSRLYLWNHLYKKTTISGHRFLDGTKNIEDWLFNLQVLVGVKSIIYFPHIGYHYCEDNLMSTSRKKTDEHLAKLSEDTMFVHKQLLTFIQSLKIDEQKKTISEALNFSVIGHLFSLYKYYTPLKYKEVVNNYKKMELFPVQKTHNKRANLFRFIANQPWLICLLMKFHCSRAQ